MLKYQIKIGENNIVIPFEGVIKSVGYDENIINTYIPNEIKNNLPDFIDFETKKISGDFTKMSFILMKNNIQITLKDFDYTNEDLEFFTKRLKNSFLLISFYDTPNKLTRKLIYNTTLFFQRKNLYINEALKNIDNAEVFFNIFKENSNETEGYNVLLSESDSLNTLYANFRFNCALDGNSYVLYPKQIANGTNIIESDEYIKINLNGDSYIYDSPEIININGENILKLYAIN